MLVRAKTVISLGRYESVHCWMKKPVSIMPKFRLFSSHIFSQTPQNITVKLRINCNISSDEFMTNNLFDIEKHNELDFCCIAKIDALFLILRSLPLSLWGLLLRFWIITINTTFVTCYDPRNETNILISFCMELKINVHTLFILIIYQEYWNKLCSNASHVKILHQNFLTNSITHCNLVCQFLNN